MWGILWKRQSPGMLGTCIVTPSGSSIECAQSVWMAGKVVPTGIALASSSMSMLRTTASAPEMTKMIAAHDWK